MIKDKDYYLSLDYDIIVDKISESDGGGYFAYYKDIPTIMGDGESIDEAIEDVKSAFKSFVEVSLKNRDLIPEPRNINKSKRVNVTIPSYLLNKIDEYVKNTI